MARVQQFLFLLTYGGVVGIGLALYRFTANELRHLGRLFGVTRRVSIPVFLVASAGFTWVSVSGHLSDDLTTAGAGAVWVTGVGLVAVALGNADTYLRARRAPTTNTGTVSPGAVVEVCGEARPADDAVAAPLSGTDVLWAEYKVDERRRLLARTVSRTVDIGTLGTPFAVDDGTGPVLVDPEGAEVRVGQDRASSVSVDGDETPPPGVREFLRRRDGLGATSNDRTYSERRIEPGDEVYVLGTADGEYAGEYPANTVIGGDSDDCFVAPGTVDDLERSLHRRVAVGGCFGVALTIGGYAALAVTAGAV